MKSTNKKLSRLLKPAGSIVTLMSVGVLLGACQTEENTQSNEENTQSNEANTPQQESEPEAQPAEDEFIDIQVSAVGDVMMHGGQIDSGYNAENNSYDFTHFFEEIQPFIEDSDLALANLETTLAGEPPYVGYPLFNAPDAIVDALDFAGFDSLVTANNHSLDTQEAGLRRTAEVVEEKGLDTIGTYSSDPDSRVTVKDVESVEIAIIGYTEHANGLENSYTSEELDSMLNLMDEERIVSDVEEAKENDPDLILAYMHWGEEYADEPSEVQTSYAELLTREGVDIILGSHPHVIQPSEILEVDGNESYVAYSMGNFISNQRRESLGEEFAPTEDGVIVNLGIQKNTETEETTLEDVEYVPTWVHRTPGDESDFNYTVLPIEDHLDNPNLSEDITNRMQNSYEETMSRIGVE